MKVKLPKFTFPGGVHPADGKHLSADKAIQTSPVPKQVAILLSQHIGAVCKPLVAKGDTVTSGQMIGKADAFVSAAVHSPVNGKVLDICLQSHTVLGRCESIIIETAEGNAPKQPVNDKFNDKFDESKYSAEQILNAAAKAGLVGMGGAGFPTVVKLQPSPDNPKKAMLINACECEPYITCDYRLMLEWTYQLLAGIKLAKKASASPVVYIGIEDNKPKAIEVLKKAIADSNCGDDIKVVTIKTKYPQGGERQLINAVLGKVVPTGKIPPMISVLVMNVATAAALAEAVVFENPLTHRIVTVTGEGINQTGNFYAPVGTSIQALIDMCGGLKDEPVKVISGGPMMGFAIGDFSMPITKTTGSITVLTEKQIGTAKFSRQQTACIRCGRCLQACPEHLNPTKIAHAVKHELYDVAQNYYMSACIECGCCSYVCPANIELTGYIKTGKIITARQKKKIPS
ncbi:MAG: electron transport complex subunit RsxC [Phycisphaerae bacterium]|nr:electron transport complex subunit RsxC [Phycisphaerae bacterium]